MILTYHFIWLLATVAYVILIRWVIVKWNRLSFTSSSVNDLPKVSILVAARNEAKQIGPLIQSFKNLNYPSNLLEVILINDHSEDDTEALFNLMKHSDWKCISLTSAYGKKAALADGYKNSSGSIILCTDADCTVPTEWVNTIISYFNDHPEANMITGLIKLDHDDNFIGRFQSLDVSATMASTAAGISSGYYHLANGANLAFRRKIFDQVDGNAYQEFASGDDVFLAQQVQSISPNSLQFLKNTSAMVTTKAEVNFSEVLAQRKRWATKSKHYPDKGLLLIQGFIWSYNLLLLIELGLLILAGSPHQYIFFTMLIVKLITDYSFLSKVSSFFKDQKSMNSFLHVFLAYTPYIIYMGIMALFPSRFIWKGRKVK